MVNVDNSSTFLSSVPSDAIFHHISSDVDGKRKYDHCDNQFIISFYFK